VYCWAFVFICERLGTVVGAVFADCGRAGRPLPPGCKLPGTLFEEGWPLYVPCGVYECGILLGLDWAYSAEGGCPRDCATGGRWKSLSDIRAVAVSPVREAVSNCDND